jgi:hypothetical protein
MNAIRKTPEFYPSESGWLISAGVVALILGSVLFIGPLVVEKKGFLDLLKYIGIILMDLLMLTMGLMLLFLGFSKNKDRKNWLKGSIITTAKIIGCNQEDVWDQYYLDTTRWVLEIVTNSSQTTGNPDSITAQVYISESQYKKYINRKSVKIYCSKDDPLVFLLEDEV